MEQTCLQAIALLSLVGMAIKAGLLRALFIDLARHAHSEAVFAMLPPLWFLPGQGEYGPFRPNAACQVPLWLAMALWRRKKCSILPPVWMSIANLEDVLSLERQEASVFQPLPFHYIEIAHFLFTGDRDEALAASVFGQHVTRIKDLVEMVQKARMAKILGGLATLQGALTVRLNHLSAMEINTIRPFFLGTLDAFDKLQVQPQQSAATMDSQSTFQSTAPAEELHVGSKDY